MKKGKGNLLTVNEKKMKKKRKQVLIYEEDF